MNYRGLIDLRRRLLRTLLGILLVVLVMSPLAAVLGRYSKLDEINSANMLEEMAMLVAENTRHAGIPVEMLIDIEECWAIEDSRTYSDVPLISAMVAGESALGFDRESNTFYCTLGENVQDNWPELTLYAGGSEADNGLRIAWVDDYTYDACQDAIREGYRYELIAYTDQLYNYCGLIFTGLPIVTVHTQPDAVFSESYIPASVSISSVSHEAVNSAAQIHLRGGGAKKPIDKLSYRIELHDLSNGTDAKRKESILGMEADCDWLLLANAQEPTAVRNTLCYDMWRRWNADNNAPMELQDRLVEVFVQDEYKGLYQLSECIRPKKELIRIGGNLLTDSVVRFVSGVNKGDQPISFETGMFVEYRYDAQGSSERAFQRYQDFAKLNQGEKTNQTSYQYMTEDAFCAQVEKHIPVAEMMSYFLFSQVCGFNADNVFNNLYIWILGENDEQRYIVSPWDMDQALPIGLDSAASMELSFRLPIRMLNLNAANCQEEARRIWQEKYETLLSSQALYDWIMGIEERINASGAYLRESEKWYGTAQPLSLAEMLYYTESRVNEIDGVVRTNGW